MKILSFIVLISLLAGCAHQAPVKSVTIYTFIYPPYTDNGPSGMFIDLITEAYKTQNIKAKFEFSTLEEAAKKASAANGLLLASRIYEGELARKRGINFEEFYNVDTQLVSIEGREKGNRMGAFSSDEIQYAETHNLTPIKYTTPNDGIKLLYENKVGRIICTDISCDQIKITNPNIKFNFEPGYSFPVDIVYFGRSPSKKVQENIASLKSGIRKMLDNGKYLEIQQSYKIANPTFQLPLEDLFQIKVTE